MHKRLANLVKYNKFILAAYRALGNLFIRFLRLFVKVKENQILFMSFGGQKYDDSPKALYEKIREDPFFEKYTLIWAFVEPEKYPEVTCRRIRVDTLRFFITAISSRYWINNSSVERGLKLRGKDTVEINTWHGTPLKRMGEDIHENHSFGFVGEKVGIRLYCAQSEYDREIFVRFFQTERENILVCDLPRNDALLTYTEGQIRGIRDRLGLPADKKVILYAPTFREYDRDALNSCYIKPPITWEKWRERLGGEYVVLLRAHYDVVKVLGCEAGGFCFDVSAYPCLNDLIAVSDCLISDYSSIYFDYAITGKPMLNFAYDFQEYQRIRGLYDEPLQALPCRINRNEDSLLEEIALLSAETYAKGVEDFRKRFAPYAGNAAQTVIEKLKEMISIQPKGM